MKRKDADTNYSKSEIEDERVTAEVIETEVTPVMLTETAFDRELLTRNLTNSPVEILEETASKEDGLNDLKSVRCNVVQRTSARVLKRTKRDSCGEMSVEQQQLSKKANKQNPQPEQLRTRRSWELWSVEDKNNFFEALCEFGKDFESIQSFIAQRSRKKGISPNMIKNKDQVRHFYYRTWHKISKYLAIGDEVKKQTQELYGLINYAELRKKIGGCLNEKNRQKLNDLVFHGVTTVKYRGKKLRIKTPICRALKKLNSLEDSKEPESPKLPKEIYVEFRPKTNAAWYHVQNLSQNPRLRTKVSLQKRLSTIIAYLEKRWKPFRLQQKEQITGSVISSPSEQSILKDSFPLLRLHPRHDTNVTRMSVLSVDSTSFVNVCLEKHVKNLDLEAKGKEYCSMKKIMQSKCKAKCTSNDSDEHSEVLGRLPFANENRNDIFGTIATITPAVNKSCDLDDDDNDDEDVKSDVNIISNPEEEANRSLSLLKNIFHPIGNDKCCHNDDCKEQEMNESNNKCTCFSEDLNEPSEEEEINNSEKTDGSGCVDLYLTAKNDNNDMTLGQLLSFSSRSEQKDDYEENATTTTTTTTVTTTTVEDKHDEINLINEERQKVSEGWTTENVGLMTVGELYLMMKCPKKLVLEYEFETSPECHADNNETAKESHIMSQLQLIGLVLKKLVTVATSYFNDFKSKQNPLSPTSRCGSQNRSVTPPNKISAGRNLNRSPGVKIASQSQVEIKNCEGLSEQESFSKSVSEESSCVPEASEENEVSVSEKENNDKHVFVVPVRAAPRNVKLRNIKDGIPESIDMITARRNQRQKRKPIVVKRALLPRSSNLGPMTVVHLLSSPSPLTAVMPSSPSPNTSLQKMILPPTKKVVNVLPTVATSSVEVRSVQIPLLKPVTAGNAIVLPTSVVSSPQIVETNPAVVNCVQSLNPNLFPQDKKSDSIISISSNSPTSVETQPPVITSVCNSDVKTLSVCTTKAPTVKNICITSSNGTSPPRISIPDRSSTNLSPQNISSFLEMSLSEEPAVSLPGSSPQQLLELGENSNSGMAEKQSTPPQSPGSRFKVNSPGPDVQWLNGESTDFSLNSLLNTFESPCKNSGHSSGDGSSLDSISRLAPDVSEHFDTKTLWSCY